MNGPTRCRTRTLAPIADAAVRPAPAIIGVDPHAADAADANPAGIIAATGIVAVAIIAMAIVIDRLDTCRGRSRLFDRLDQRYSPKEDTNRRLTKLEEKVL